MKDKRDIKETINEIASNLILKQTLNDMTNLNNEKYCNKLLIISSDILNKKFNKKEISYIASKLLDSSIKYNENVGFMLKKDIDKWDIKDEELKKKLCMSISKFYIKLANLWYAIISTVNPVLTYYSKENEEVDVDFGLSNNELKDYNIDIDQKPDSISSGSFCAKRINVLNNTITLDKNKNYVLKKKLFCKNSDLQYKNEPGIVELEHLYYDDYDENNQFTDITQKNAQMYRNDLESFYMALTGKKLPSEVNRFSDIKIKHASKDLICSMEESEYKFNKNDLLSDELFKKYAISLKKMIINSNNKKKKFIKIIDELFLVNKKTNEVTINPKLTSSRLDELIIISRDIILDLYIGCEKDYLEIENILNTIIEVFIPLRREKVKLDTIDEFYREKYYDDLVKYNY